MTKPESHRAPVEVSAGLVFHEGRLLIAQRFATSHLGGLWEFPGGKRHEGETFQACLVRELREELAIDVEVGEVFETVTHSYPEKTVHLEFFLCRLLKGQPQAIGCAAFAWVSMSDLPNYPFPAADAQLLQKLQDCPKLWSQRR